MSEFEGEAKRDAGMPLALPPYEHPSDVLRAERLGGDAKATRRDGRFAWRGLMRERFVKLHQEHPDIPIGDQ